MKKLIVFLLAASTLAGCATGNGKGKFTVQGTIKNLPEQKVYLEQLYFSNERNPEVLDTALVKNGRFTLRAKAETEGLYRIRLEKDRAVFVFINDQPELQFSADLNQLSMKSATVSSPANQMLRQFIAETDQRLTALYNKGNELNALQRDAGNDSLMAAGGKAYDRLVEDFQQYVTAYIDTVKHPILALFALGYTSRMDPAALQQPVEKLQQRFPGNAQVAEVAARFSEALQQARQREQARKDVPGVGDLAPDFSLPDPDGKTVALSSLRGKYVLVDFWASWCGPCRAENPNVVKAFNRFKEKNFTVLGVSLDKDKAAWLKAIQADGLNWPHISDLRQWNSVVVGLYHIEGIPYNVLLDPQGKIIAVGLRGEDLENKLAEVLK